MTGMTAGSSRRRFGGLCLVLLLIQISCVVPSLDLARATPTVEPAPMEGLATIVAQTFAAARTQTATAMPSATPTATPTRTLTPTITSTLSTATPTFFFSLYSPTPPISLVIESPIPIGTESGSSGEAGSDAAPELTSGQKKYNKATQPTGKPWTCAVVGKSPPMGAVVERNKPFNVVWTVLNTGTKTWTNNTIDFVFHSGFRNEGRAKQDMQAVSVPTGGKTTVTVLYKAPKQEGIYSSIWSLKVGNRPFCYMKITFEVESNR